MDHLEQLIQKAVGQYQTVFIISEGIFSMDGDICNLPRLVEIKHKYGGLLYIDEAHSIGVLGKTGGGVCQHFNIDPTEVDVLMGTLSKSLVSCGGYIAGSKILIDYLKFKSEGFIFSTGISPPNVAASLGALEIMINEDWRLKRLGENAEYILEALKSRSIDTGLSKSTPIIPINVGKENTAIQLSLYLNENAILAAPIIPPAVPENESRVRLFISALHKKEQLDYTTEKIIEGLEKLRAG
ncbi:aminotransferase class I/II-fold pyridoxal phosphate-dependent enzyme [Legionella antarctica]|nr:aminotransferase class I/II-fold pyridoxal phosphate-dependent enzyme [Legionella antarctica]